SHAELRCVAVAAGKAQGTRLRPTQPAPVQLEAHSLLAQPPYPAAQQGRGLEVGGEHAPGAADHGGNAQVLRPLAQLLRAERLKPSAHDSLPRTIAANKDLE